jgi:pyridoxamine 5'-phosphate oxidase
MTKEEIYEFTKKNPVFSLATSEENKPHVRMIMLYRADENGIIFNTGENKDLHRQLQANPQVEMCFYNADEGRQVRIEGSVETLEDLELKKRVVADYPFLQEWVDREGYEVLIVYCLKNGKATTWTMETNFQPKEYIQL